MEKKVQRLQRWLNRISAACEHKRWDSAVVEVDSLCAEAREMRGEFCRMMESGEESGAGRIFSRKSVAMSLKSAVIAIFIVMASTIPLAVEADRPWTVPVAEVKEEKKTDRLGWMTPEEENLLRALREDANKAKQVKAAQANPASVKPAAETASAKPVVRTQPSEQKRAAAETEIAPEELMALIQAGEKALRGNEPAIKVIK